MGNTLHVLIFVHILGGGEVRSTPFVLNSKSVGLNNLGEEGPARALLHPLESVDDGNKLGVTGGELRLVVPGNVLEGGNEVTHS